MTQWYSFMLPVVRLKVSHIWRNAWIIYRCYRDTETPGSSLEREDDDIQNIATINCSIFELFYTCKVQWKEVSKHKVKEPPNKPWYIFAEVRTYLNYFIVTTTRGTWEVKQIYACKQLTAAPYMEVILISKDTCDHVKGLKLDWCCLILKYTRLWSYKLEGTKAPFLVFTGHSQ